MVSKRAVPKLARRWNCTRKLASADVESFGLKLMLGTTSVVACALGANKKPCSLALPRRAKFLFQ